MAATISEEDMLRLFQPLKNESVLNLSDVNSSKLDDFKAALQNQNIVGSDRPGRASSVPCAWPAEAQARPSTPVHVTGRANFIFKSQLGVAVPCPVAWVSQKEARPGRPKARPGRSLIVGNFPIVTETVWDSYDSKTLVLQAGQHWFEALAQVCRTNRKNVRKGDCHQVTTRECRQLERFTGFCEASVGTRRESKDGMEGVGAS